MIVTRDYMAIAAFCEYPKGIRANDVKCVLDSLSERDRGIVQSAYSNEWVSRSSSIRAKAIKDSAAKYSVSCDIVYRVLREARKKFTEIQEHS